MLRARFVLSALILFAAIAVVAGPPADGELEGISPAELFPGATFDPAIPTQKDLIGFEHGATRPRSRGSTTFREEHVRRMDPRGRAAAEDAGLLEQAKAVAWMAYGIHGDELSSVDAAAAVAYWLVAGEDDLARKMRARWSS